MDIWQLRRELEHLLYVTEDLNALVANYGIDADNLAFLRRRYRDRYAAVYAEWQRKSYGETPQLVPVAPATEPSRVTSTEIATTSTAETSGSSVPVQVSIPAMPSQPWFREFLTDNAIYLLSYLGAFALIVATLLFEVYSQDLGGSVHFAAVLALDAVFLASGLYSFRRVDLRIVGRSYLVIFALLVPLVFYAAYRFLALYQFGITAEATVAVAAFVCTLTYGALARRVQAIGYAALSLAALPIAIHGAVVNYVSSGWEAACFGVLPPIYWLIARSALPQDAWRGLFQLPAKFGVHIACALCAVLASAYALADYLSLSAGGGVRAGYLPIALALATLGEALAAQLTRDRLVSMIAGLGLVATVLCGIYSLRFDAYGGVAVLSAVIVLAWIAARVTTRRQDAWAIVTIPAELVLHVASLFIVVLTITSALNEVTPAGSNGLRFGYLPLGLTGVAIAEALAFALRRDEISALFSHLALTGAVLAGSASLRLGADGAAEGLLVLGIADTVVCLLIARFAKTSAIAGETIAAQPAAWSKPAAAAAVLQVLMATLFPTSAGLVTALVVATAVAVGLATALQYRDAKWLLVPVAAIMMTAFLQFSLYPDLTEVPRRVFLPVGTGLLTLAFVIMSAVQRRRDLVWAASLALTATSFTALYTFDGGNAWYAWASLLLGITGVATLRVEPTSYGRSIMAVRAAAQLGLTALIPINNDPSSALLLSLASAAAIGLVLQTRTPAWILLATSLLAVDWWWLGKLLFSLESKPSLNTIGILYSPLPILFTAGGIVLALGKQRLALRWRQPLYASAAGIALLILGLGLAAGNLALLGWMLLCDACLIYLAGVVEGVASSVPASVHFADMLESATTTIPASVLVAAMGVLCLLSSAFAPMWSYPLALIGLTAMVFSLGELHRAFGGERRRAWAYWHNTSAFGLSALTAIVFVEDQEFFVAGSAGALTSMLAALAASGLLIYIARLQRIALLEYAALCLTALSTFWVPVYAGITNPQGYVLVPGLAAVVLGLRMRGDRRTGLDPSLAQWLLSIGLVLLLGTSEFQSIDPNNLDQAPYVAVLVLESVMALVLAIATRSRALGLAAGIGLALAAFHALLVVVQSVPLYAVFGLAALLLLAGATSLALGRERWIETRRVWQTTWSNWI